jgi:hypothetical protein
LSDINETVRQQREELRALIKEKYGIDVPLIAEVQAVETTREALFSVGAQDMPVAGYEVREAMDAFEKAVRADQTRLDAEKILDDMTVMGQPGDSYAVAYAEVLRPDAADLLDQDLPVEALDPALVIASAINRLDYPEGRSQQLYLAEEVNNILVTLEIEFDGGKFLALALGDQETA